MKRIISFIIGFSIVGLLGGKSVMAQNFDLTKNTSSFSVDTMPIVLRQTTDTGLESSNIVAFELTAFGGVNLADKAGTLTLMTNLLKKGTYSYSKEQIDGLLTKTGADLSINAGYDSVNITLKCLKRFLPELLPLVSEMIRVPKFDENEIKLSKAQLTARLKSEQASADPLLGLKMEQIFYKNHPYYRRPTGYLDTIAGITREDLATSLFKTFNKNNVLFILAGDIGKDEVSNMIQKYFSALQAGVRSTDVRQPLQNEHKEIHYYSFAAPTTYFMAKFKAPSLDSQDYPTLLLATQILDNRLFEEIRTKRALTYSVSASLRNYRVNSGTLYVTSTQLPKAVEIMFEEVKKMQVAPVSTDDLETQVNKYLSSWYLSRETKMSQADIFSLYETLGLGWENSNSFIDRLNKVTPDQVMKAAQEYYKDFSFVVVGPQAVNLRPELTKLGFLPFSPQKLAAPKRTMPAASVKSSTKKRPHIAKPKKKKTRKQKTLKKPSAVKTPDQKKSK